MSETRRVLLVGATGLIGRKVIARGRRIDGLALLALARRELQLPRGARMELMLADSDNWPQAIATIAPDAVICALGTTIARSGKQGQQAVDRDLVIDVGRAARQAGADQFVLVSSVGADPHAKAFYLQLKGEAEQGLRKLKFARLDILRPGLLRGKRYGDIRPAEKIGQWLAPVLDIVLHGSKRRFRSIRAEDVAAAALQAARTQARGTFVHEFDGLMRLARNLRREADGK